eukprot:194642-Pyramimonas_sp.AAC.1
MPTGGRPHRAREPEGGGMVWSQGGGGVWSQGVGSLVRGEVSVKCSEPREEPQNPTKSEEYQRHLQGVHVVHRMIREDPIGVCCTVREGHKRPKR